MPAHRPAENLSCLRKYIITTALSAVGFVTLTGPALADNWADHVATEGAISIDASTPNTTNITQGTDFVKVRGDGDINAGWTVNVNQPSRSSKYVLYDIEGDPTKIEGDLNANGRVYIFDSNGVIFGAGSQVNVGSIVATTGTVSDDDIKSGSRLRFENAGHTGKIELRGSMTVGDGGLAAFVAPTVVNSGVINAKMGTVVMAAGERATLDFYGDDLIQVSVDGKLSNALIKNKGKINAAGGTVVMSVDAAKEAVDNVINMDGIVDVSSVSVKGGKIILSGGSKGAVTVSGKLNASGTSGGNIKITGQNVDITNTAEVTADAGQNGDGGKVYIYGNDYALFRGRLRARGGIVSGDGGEAEISGGESVGYYGLSDLGADNGQTGTLLIDPKILNIGNGNPLTTLAEIAADIASGGTGTVNIDDQALANTLRLSNVNLWATQKINTTSEVDISTWQGPILKGITTKTLTLAAPVINILHDVILGKGSLNLYDMAEGTSMAGGGLYEVPAGGVQVDKLNLDGIFYKRSTVGGALTQAGDDQLNSQVHRVHVLSDAAKIQQAVYLADDGGNGIINVEPGFFNESVAVAKSVNIRGANAGVDPTTDPWGAVTFVTPPGSSDGFHITADDVTVSGFFIVNTVNGVSIDNADHINILNNIIIGSAENGVYAYKSNDINVKRNVVADSGLEGIYVLEGADASILSNSVALTGNGDAIRVRYTQKADINHNRIADTHGSGISLEYSGGGLNVNYNIIGEPRSGGVIPSYILGNGIYVDNVQTGANIWGNEIYNTQSSIYDDANGIYLHDSDNIRVGGMASGRENTIIGAAWDGIKISGGTDNLITNNLIRRSGRAGIYGEGTHYLTVAENRVRSSNNSTMGGISMIGGNDIKIIGNHILDRATATANSGIFLLLVDGMNKIRDNIIRGIHGDGIHVQDSNDVTIGQNKIFNVEGDGIYVEGTSGNTKITGNRVGSIFTQILGNGIHITNIAGNTNIHGNRVVNADGRGLYVSGGKMGRVVVRDNVFKNNPVGAEFESGRIILTGDGNIFQGGQVGMRFAPFDLGGGNFANLLLRDDDANPDTAYPATPNNFGGTIGAQTFEGQSLYYVEFANNAFFSGGIPMWINGLNSSYDGLIPAGITGLEESDYNSIEDLIFHYADQPDVGAFYFGFISPPIPPIDLEESPDGEGAADIAQEDIFNVFGAFNGLQRTGFSLRIRGLPPLPGFGRGRNLNNIQTFAGGGNAPGNLNNIQTAAGGSAQQRGSSNPAEGPEDIEPASGDTETGCMGDALNAAGSGQTADIVYSGTMSENLEQAANCGAGF